MASTKRPKWSRPGLSAIQAAILAGRSGGAQGVRPRQARAAGRAQANCTHLQHRNEQKYYRNEQKYPVRRYVGPLVAFAFTPTTFPPVTLS